MEKVLRIAETTEGVLGVVGTWAEYISPGSIHVELQVNVASGISIDTANAKACTVCQRVQSEMNCLDCSVHPEP
jgi:divalent metal cation (Fe/Co/Zn/Cd) transporter